MCYCGANVPHGSQGAALSFRVLENRLDYRDASHEHKPKRETQSRSCGRVSIEMGHIADRGEMWRGVERHRRGKKP